jgi:5-methylcytosine-specific restriction endonuclease McrA
MRKLVLDFWYKGIVAPIWRMKRRIVFFRDRGRCRYCLEKLTCKTFTVDHVVPVSGGGSDAFSNLVACCKYCNKFKGNRIVDATMKNEMWMAAYRRHQHYSAVARRVRNL